MACCAGLGGVRRPGCRWAKRAGEERPCGASGSWFPEGRRVGPGLGQSFAQLTALVQNLIGVQGKGGGRVGGCPGAEPTPRPELAPFSSSQTSEMGGVQGRRGGREGSHPFPPVEPGQKQSSRGCRAG